MIDMFRMPYLVSQTNKRLKDTTSVKEKNISDAYTLWFPFGLLGEYTVKPVLSGHSIIYKTKVLMENDSLMKVESIAECSLWSILQYF